MKQLTHYMNKYSESEDDRDIRAHITFKKFRKVIEVLHTLNKTIDDDMDKYYSIITNYYKNTETLDIVTMLVWASHYINFEKVSEEMEQQEKMVQSGTLPESDYLDYCKHIKFMYQINKDFKEICLKN